MTPLDILGPDRRTVDEWLDDWIAEHERTAYIASEVITVLTLLVAVALMIGGVQAFVWWWTA